MQLQLHPVWVPAFLQGMFLAIFRIYYKSVVLGGSHEGSGLLDLTEGLSSRNAEANLDVCMRVCSLSLFWWQFGDGFGDWVTVLVTTNQTPKPSLNFSYLMNFHVRIATKTITPSPESSPEPSTINSFGNFDNYLWRWLLVTVILSRRI